MEIFYVMKQHQKIRIFKKKKQLEYANIEIKQQTLKNIKH